MATDKHKLTVQEALNSALNDDYDALKVDLSNADFSGTQISVDLDSSEDSVTAKIDETSNYYSKFVTQNGHIEGMKDDIAAVKDDIQEILDLITEMKDTTDKLDGCIDGTKLAVDVVSSVPVPET